MNGRTILVVSASHDETARLVDCGPRRDFLEVARRLDAPVIYRTGSPRRGWGGRLLGPHLRQAWQAASLSRPGDTIFADGEHLGVPLLLVLALRLQRGRRVVMLGHLLSKPWKGILLRLATRTSTAGVVVVHSEEQARTARAAVGRSWLVRQVPYQVDADFWRGGSPLAGDLPLILAVGSENRDYRTLVAAVRGLRARVVIAAGSHWARKTAQAGNLPANVELLTAPLPFADLRRLYEQAAVVAVPLEDVANQSGVTTLLEAMSMGRPVVVSATRGQREYVRGALMRPDGMLDRAATAGRGPGDAADAGVYVPPGHAGALRAAFVRLLSDADLAATLGAGGRRTIADHFTVEQYTAALAECLAPTPCPPRAPAVTPAGTPA
ncbi:MAG: glycosyltransferase family 4 protein [Dehalococcoidia bacterium]|nr:glycosyltransferase family 4 protein [Dehalococcoidia bacterium]